MTFVKPAFEDHIKPKAKFADFTVRGDTWDKVAREFVLENLKNKVEKIEASRKKWFYELYIYTTKFKYE